MIPNWQMRVILIAAFALLIVAVLTSPYAKAVFSGACDGPSRPANCYRGTGGAHP